MNCSISGSALRRRSDGHLGAAGGCAPDRSLIGAMVLAGVEPGIIVKASPSATAAQQTATSTHLGATRLLAAVGCAGRAT